MKQYKWTVIGAGAAGIAAIGKLLELNIDGDAILWIDPDFKGGDLGKLWRKVSSNTTVDRFLNYFERYQSFEWSTFADKLAISKLPIKDTCLLAYPADALLAITDVLKRKVVVKHDWVKSLVRDKDHGWIIESREGSVNSKHIILAQGAEPNVLMMKQSPPMLPLVDAIDPDRLKKCFNKDYTYAVFGASHSAIIILENLTKIGAKKVVNFYKHPCKYAVDKGDWILYDDSGLKGKAAQWAKQHIDGDSHPQNLIRHECTESNIQQYLPLCDQVIYATGFHRRGTIQVQGVDLNQYDPISGEIAPGLFGYGIAYPEKYLTPINEIEYRVGLSKFVDYMDSVEQHWLVDTI